MFWPKTPLAPHCLAASSIEEGDKRTTFVCQCGQEFNGFTLAGVRLRFIAHIRDEGGGRVWERGQRDWIE